MIIIDLIKAVASGGKDDLSKVGKKTVKRLIYAVLLFLIPTILNWVFSIFGIYGVWFAFPLFEIIAMIISVIIMKSKLRTIEE